VRRSEDATVPIGTHRPYHRIQLLSLLTRPTTHTKARKRDSLLVSSTPTPQGFSFEIITPKRIYDLAATSNEETTYWVRILPIKSCCWWC
jgi:hypothetical protein